MAPIWRWRHPRWMELEKGYSPLKRFRRTLCPVDEWRLTKGFNQGTLPEGCWKFGWTTQALVQFANLLPVCFRLWYLAEVASLPGKTPEYLGIHCGHHVRPSFHSERWDHRDGMLSREHANICYAMGMGGMMQTFICLISDLNFQNTTPFLLFPLPTPRVFLASQHEIARFWKDGVLAFFHSPLSQLRFFHRAGNPPKPPQSWQSQFLALDWWFQLSVRKPY